jgi:hypothetical protein
MFKGIAGRLAMMPSAQVPGRQQRRWLGRSHKGIERQRRRSSSSRSKHRLLPANCSLQQTALSSAAKRRYISDETCPG